MKKIKLWSWIIVLIIIPAGLNAQGGKSVSLNECIKIALKNNTQIVSAKSNFMIHKANLRSAWGNFLPQISANAQYRKRSEELIMFRYQDLISSKDSYYYDINVSQPIFSGFRNYANLKKGQLNREMYEYYLVNTEQMIQLEVKSKYYDVIKNKELLEIAQETLKAGEEELERIETMQRVGSVSKAEVFQQKVRVGENRLSLIQAESALTTAKTELNHTLGIDVDTDLQLQEEELNYNKIDFNFDELVEVAFTNRVDYLAVKNKLNSAKYDIMVSRSGYYPQMNLSANYNWFDVNFPQNQRDLNEFDSYSFSVNMSFNIFNQLQTSSNVSVAKATKIAVDAELEQTKRQVKLDVKQAILNLEMAEENINVTNENLVAAEEDYRLAKERYAIGAGTLLEQITSEISLTKAKANRIEALYNYKYNLAALELAVGKLEVID